jgi:hypothetical protein
VQREREERALWEQLADEAEKAKLSLAATPGTANHSRRRFATDNSCPNFSGRGCGGCDRYRRSRDPDEKQWVIPPEANAAFVASMEDVLEVYQRPHDPDRPVVCVDETTKQLIKETRVPVPAKPGQPARHDYEYERNGTANLFMMFAPLEAWRHVEVTDRQAALDYAQVLKALSDRHFVDASKIILVQDNLSTHKPASLYAAFPATEACRLVERFEGNGFVDEFDLNGKLVDRVVSHGPLGSPCCKNGGFTRRRHVDHQGSRSPHL